jgi:hypothetical protein
MVWLDDAPDEVLALKRFTSEGDQPAVAIVINMGDEASHLPSSWGTDILIASSDDVAVVSVEESDHIVIGPETAVWLRA